MASKGISAPLILVLLRVINASTFSSVKILLSIFRTGSEKEIVTILPMPTPLTPCPGENTIIGGTWSLSVNGPVVCAVPIASAGLAASYIEDSFTG